MGTTTDLVNLNNKYKVYQEFGEDLIQTLNEIKGIRTEKSYAKELMRDSSNFLANLNYESAKKWIFDHWDFIPSFLKGNSFVLNSIDIDSVFENPIAFVTVIYEEFLNSVSMHMLYHDCFKKEEGNFKIDSLRFARIDDKFITNIEKVLRNFNN